MFDGKRTYLAAGAAAATTVASVLSGELNPKTGLIVGLLAISQIFLRSAIKKSEPQFPISNAQNQK